MNNSFIGIRQAIVYIKMSMHSQTRGLLVFKIIHGAIVISNEYVQL